LQRRRARRLSRRIVLLLVFLIVPVATVSTSPSPSGAPAPSPRELRDFARTDLFVRSFWNSVYVSAMAVVLSSSFALPLAYFTSRFEFRGAALVQTLGFIPLIMPPFVGAVAMQLLFGRNGRVNLLLDEWFGFKIGFHGGPQRRHLRPGRPLLPRSS
jgi:iron(III) transport system permease protein